jgi:predicted nucleotidyltransferase
MRKRDRQILDQLARELRARFPEARVWAFGSRARGTATKDSDFDVCIVLDQWDEAIDEVILELAWRVSFEHSVVITTVPYTREEFEHGPCSVSPLVRTVLREGVPV